MSERSSSNTLCLVSKSLRKDIASSSNYSGRRFFSEAILSNEGCSLSRFCLFLGLNPFMIPLIWTLWMNQSASYFDCVSMRLDLTWWVSYLIIKFHPHRDFLGLSSRSLSSDIGSATWRFHLWSRILSCPSRWNYYTLAPVIFACFTDGGGMCCFKCLKTVNKAS